MRTGSKGVCLTDEGRGTDTTRLDSVKAQNILLVLLAAVCGLLHPLGLPQYWFLSGILPRMQQPGTVHIQSTLWLHPALVMESFIADYVLCLDALSSYIGKALTSLTLSRRGITVSKIQNDRCLEVISKALW